MQHAVRLVIFHVVAELKKIVRMRAYGIAVVAGPALLYGLSLSNPRVQDIDGLPGRVYLLATYGTFVLFGVALFGVGLGSCFERERGVWASIRRSPTPLWAPLVAKVVACCAVTTVALAVIVGESALLFGGQIPWVRLPWIVAAMIVSSVPLCALALWLGASFRASAIPIVLVVVYLVLSSVSGIVVPMEMLARGGATLPRIAPLWPTYHAGELALAAVRPTALAKVAHHLGMLALCTVIFGGLAVLRYRREFVR